MTPSDAPPDDTPASCHDHPVDENLEIAEAPYPQPAPAREWSAGPEFKPAAPGHRAEGDEDEKEAVVADYDDEEVEEEEAEEAEEEPYEPYQKPDPFLEIREELAAAGAESRRTARRQMDVLKEFGTAIAAVGNIVRDLHASSRAATPKTAPPAGNDALLLPLIEMADRIARTAEAFRTPPATAPTGWPSWWPGQSMDLTTWQTAWESQKAALFILRSHMDTLLTRAGLERIPVGGTVFDPTTMSAVEVHTDPTIPDHTVIAELLSGWRLAGSNRIIRPAQVKVSRTA